MLYVIFILGLLVGVGCLLLVLAGVKKLRPKPALLTATVSLLLALLLGGGAWWYQATTTNTATGNSDYTTKLTANRGFKLLSSGQQTDDDEYTFTTDSAGKFTLKLKGLSNTTVKIEDDDDSSTAHFKTKRVALKKGKVTKVTISLPSGETSHSFTLEDYFDDGFDFTLVTPAASSSSQSASDWESK